MCAKTRLRIRRALPSDKPAVLRLTRDVWEGTDYVPLVWDEWVHASDGYLMVAEEGGEVVGTQHAELQPDGTSWLEGIRVAKGAQGRGIARVMLDHAMQWSIEMGCPVARLSTFSGNPASNRLAEGAGMELIAHFVPAKAKASATGPTAEGVRVCGPADVVSVLHGLQDHGVSLNALYTEGWTVYSVTRERLAVLLASHAIITSGGSSITAAAIATASVSRSTIKLGLLTGDAAGMTRICTWLRGAAARAGMESVRATLAGEKAELAMHEAGYERDDEHVMNLWEMRF